MAAVGTDDTGHAIVRTIGIGGIILVTVFEYHVVLIFGKGKREFTFAMCHPNAQFIARERSQHHALIGLYLHAHKSAFKLVAVVVEHLRTGRMVGMNQTEFDHQLTAVAHTQREGVATGVEAVESGFGHGVVEECTCPAFGRTQHIAVGEPAAEDNHVDVVERFATGDEVGHRDIFHVKSREIECISHFAFAIGTLLTDDGGFHTRRCAAVGADAETFKTAVESGVEMGVERLLLIVFKAFFCLTVETLFGVEKVRSAVPNVTQPVNVEGVRLAVLFDKDAAFGTGAADGGKGNALSCEQRLKCTPLRIAHLNEQSRIFGKEDFHQVVVGKGIELQRQTAFDVGKTHFESGRDETTGADVVAGEKHTLLY